MATAKKDTPVAAQASNLPATINMQGDSNIGRETLSAQDMAIPYVSILQSLSPQVKKGEARIEDAEEGDIFNSVTQEVWAGEDGIRAIPCAFQRAYVEWKPRTSGGGWVASHDSAAVLDTCSRNDLGQDVLPNGNIIVLTNYHYCLLIDENENILDRVVIPFSSTQLKKSRKWNSLMSAITTQGSEGVFNPPMFSHSYQMTTVHEDNSKGDWYGWVITNKGMLTNPKTYEAAKKFAIDVSKGNVKAAVPTNDLAGQEEVY